MKDFSLLINFVLSGGLSFIIVFFSVPVVYNIAIKKRIFIIPGGRHIHKQAVPNLGGIAIFFGLLFTFSVFSEFVYFKDLAFFQPSLLILFIIGVKDDLLVTAPFFKLLGQLAAAFLVSAFGGGIIADGHLLKWFTPGFGFNLLFSMLLIVLIINSFNLIDGVDGLAASQGIISIMGFSGWYALTGKYSMVIFGCLVTGAYLAYIYYNVFSKKQKIFMGDTGALLLGFIVSLFVINFINDAGEASLYAPAQSAPAVAVGLVLIPLLDTLWVFTSRIICGKSPFSGDKKHIHHRLLRLGFSHIQVTVILGCLSLFFLFFSFNAASLGIGTIPLLLIDALLGIFVFKLPSKIYAKRISARKSRLEQEILARKIEDKLVLSEVEEDG